MRCNQRRSTHRNLSSTLRGVGTRAVSVFLLCALALAGFSFINVVIPVAVAEDGNPPCPGGCPGDSIPEDTIPVPPQLVSENPTTVVPWYFSLLLLAF